MLSRREFHTVKFFSVFVASAASVVALAVVPFSPAIAGTSVGSFEIDGNRTDSAPGEPLDWNDLGTDPTAHITPFTDGTGSTDDGYTNGSKELFSSAWKCGTNNDPGKVDIKNGDIAFRTINGHQYVYVDFSRWTTNGDSHIDYEFSQSAAAASSTCTQVPKRSVGDITITFDTDNTTHTLLVRAFKWTALGGKNGDTPTSLGVGSQGSTWDGAVSTDQSYGEAVLDLTGTIGTIACGQFAGAYMKSRSSASISASLQDYVGKQPINPGNCPQSDLKKEVRNASVTPADDFGSTADALPGQQVEYRLTYTNSGPGAANNVVISDQLSAGQTLVANSCMPVTSPCTATTTKPTWTFSQIAANGGTQVVTFKVTINSNITPLPTTISNIGVVDTTEESPRDSNSTTVNVLGTPNLKVSDKQAYDSRGRLVTTVNPNDVVTYKVTVSNTGTAPGSIDFVDDYDDLLNPSAVTTNDGIGSCTKDTIGGNKVFSCTSGQVAAGGSRVFTYTAQMPAKIVITDGRTAGCPDNNTSDYPIKNVVLVGGIEVIHRTVCLHVAPNLVGTKSASPTVVDAGGTVTYTLSLTNNGNAPGSDSVTDNGASGRLTNITVTQNDSGWTCTVNNGVTCTSGPIDPGATQFVKYTAQVPSSFTSTDSHGSCLTSGPQQFAVTNTATFGNSGPKTATVCVNADAQFTVVKKVNGSTDPIIANPGDTVTYTIAVKNVGKGPGTDTFPDDYADQLTNVTTPTGDKGGICTATLVNGNKGWSCTTATLNPGVTETFTYTAKLPATVTGLQQGTCGSGYFLIKNVISPTVHADVCIPGSPQITWKKQAFNAAGQEITGGTVSPDQIVTYRITADNSKGTAAGSATYTDDYDDLLSPSTPTASGNGTGSCTPSGKTFVCSVTVPAGGSETFTYTAQMPHQITIADGRTPGGPDCATTTNLSYPIKNLVLVNGVVVTSKTVCLELSPDLTPLKTLDSGTPAPGATVTYAITVTNNGNAPGSTTVHDTSNGALSNVQITVTPTGWSCSVTNNVIDCTTGAIDPGQSQTLKYTAKLPSTYTGAPGSPNNTPCTSDPHQYPVANKVTLGNGKTSTKIVCVPASPVLKLTKSVVTTTDAAGTEYLTYTLAYGNTGPAEATSATITELIPTGTTFSSCTGGCSPVINGQTTWTVGPIAPLTPNAGSVTLTVAVTTDQTCTISNTAQIKFMNDAVVFSNTVNVPIVPRPHPENANASGSTTALAVTASGIVGLNLGVAGAASSSQHGVGVNSNVDNPVSVNLGTLLTATALRTTSTSRVTSAPAAARNTSSAEVAGLCLKIAIGPCLVSSDTVRAVASTVATGSYASSSTAGTTIENLLVAGMTPAQIGLDLNTTNSVTVAVDLITTVEVSVNERQDNPTPGLYGSTYKAGLTVTALHIKVRVLGLLKTEVIVSQATSYSDFPQTFVCTVGANQSVSGNATIASAAATTALTGKLADDALGYVELPPLGGSDSQHIVGASVLGGNAASAQVADSLTEGTVNPNLSSTSHSYAEIAGDGSTPACVLRMGTGCLVTATVIRSEASTTSYANGSVSNDAGTQFVNAKVNIGPGITLPLNPDPNTRIDLPGLGYLVVNEQVCDNGGNATHTCTGAHHSGITVRALHLVLNVLNNPSAFLAGADVIVVEAHSDGSFG